MRGRYGRQPRRAPGGRLASDLVSGRTAAAWAEHQIAAVRDDPGARIALVERSYRGPFGQAPRHLPYRRAAKSFMRWQLRRGVLAPAHSHRPGSPWWRAVNERLLRDAHNSSVIAGHLDHRDLAEAENIAGRFFMNVVLTRVFYAHALVAAPRLSLDWLRPLAPFLGDPRLGMTGIFLQLPRMLPDEYPFTREVSHYLSNELGFGRLLDYGVIVPRLQQLYEWSAHELGAPGLLDCTRDGALTYAWPFEEREVWRPGRSFVLQLAHGALPPEREGGETRSAGS